MLVVAVLLWFASLFWIVFLLNDNRDDGGGKDGP